MKTARLKKLWLPALVLLTAAALLAGYFLRLAGAVWDEAQAVHIDPDEIEDSTLAIGSHLIHLSALTDTIYEIADESAGESGQSEIYYKSELAEGTWFDITSASTLADITTGGSPVDKEVIAALFFTHHTKSDGVTYDLRTGQPVDPRDIRDPYDLESMEELFPLKNQLDLLEETQSESDAGQEKIDGLHQFFSTQVVNEETQARDQELEALRAYHDVLKNNNGGANEMGQVQSVMDAVDAQRRVTVFTILEDTLSAYLESLSSVADSTGEDGETEEGAAPDTQLQSAASDSLQNVKNSRIEYEGKMLDEGTTTMSAVTCEVSRQLIDDAVANNHAACDEDVARLLALSNITADTISDRELELSLLDEQLIPRATDTYTGGLGQGVNAEYNAAQAQNSAAVLLQSIADANASTLNTYRGELEFFLTAKTDRMATDAAMACTGERLSLTGGWYGAVPADAFQAGASASIDAHVEFLTQLRRTLELALGGNELDALIAEKAALQQEMMGCLDENDLAGAAALEEQIAGVDEQIAALEQQAADRVSDLNDQISSLEDQLDAANASGDTALADALANSLGSLQTQLAEAQASLGDGSLGALVAQLRSQGLSAIDEGNTSSLNDAIAGLEGLLGTDYQLAFPALQDLHEAMAYERDVNGDNSFGGALAAVEQAILDNADAYAAAMRADKTAADLAAIAEAFFADGTGSALDDPVVELIALQMYLDETGSGAAASRLAALALQQMNLGHPLVYLRVDDAGFEYLPLSAMARYTGMRHVWNRNANAGTLARGSTYYEFTVYSDAVTRGQAEEDVDHMARPARYQAGVHVPETYAYQEFGVEAVYLSGTSYGVLCSDELRSRAEELFALFLS